MLGETKWAPGGQRGKKLVLDTLLVLFSPVRAYVIKCVRVYKCVCVCVCVCV